jgi:hypothetical protein
VVVGGEGLYTQAYAQTAIGRYNTLQGTGATYTYGDQAFIIGNGTSTSSRATSFYITNDGKLWAATSMTVGTTSGAVSTAVLNVKGSVMVVNSTDKTLFNATGNTVRIGAKDSNVSLFVNGSINATGTITQNSGFDVAEMFSATESMAAGDLVAIVGANSVKKATQAESFLTIGAISTQPGFILANPELPNAVIVGLSGRIPVNIKGPVSKGDFITVSDVPGVGMTATEPGYVIGRALEDSNSSTVMMIIQPSYFSPQLDANAKLIGGRQDKTYKGASQALQVAEDDNSITIGRAGMDVVVTLG